MLYQRAALSSKAFAGRRSLIASQLSSLDSRNAGGRTNPPPDLPVRGSFQSPIRHNLASRRNLGRNRRILDSAGANPPGPTDGFPSGLGTA